MLFRITGPDLCVFLVCFFFILITIHFLFCLFPELFLCCVFLYTSISIPSIAQVGDSLVTVVTVVTVVGVVVLCWQQDPVLGGYVNKLWRDAVWKQV